MGKIKRIIAIVVLTSLFAFCLFGCQNSKVTYTDPDTGEEKEITIEKTSNNQEVVDSLYAICLSNVPIKTLEKETSVLEFSAKLKVNYSSEDCDEIEFNGKLTYSADSHYDDSMEGYYDYLKASLASVKLEVKGKVPNEEGKLESFSTSTIEVFLEEGFLYGKVDIDSVLVKYISSKDNELGEKIKLINEKVIKLDLKDYVSSSALNNVLEAYGTKGDKTVRDLIESSGASLKELRAMIEEIVNEYGITITKVSGGEVTYSSDKIGISEKLTAKLDLTINVAEVSFVEAKGTATIDLYLFSGTIDFDLESSYKAKVARISNSDKEEAVDFNTLFGSVSDPLGDPIPEE